MSEARPEIVQWFHEGVEQCEHDYEPPPCELSADALLRAFTVEPRLYEHKDGTFSYESGHFRRLAASQPAPADPERREDGTYLGGPIGFHVCPACGIQHELSPAPAGVREPEEFEASEYADRAEGETR